ncbi:MAG: sugar phosphate isomerase/epimerase family protein [Kiritimatiellia bacterium]|jgi:sugar phosphate isomerase/epimerase|nr:sugar phosphate isomerase/epimerase family protein [Kiritimatiellia bacterium]
MRFTRRSFLRHSAAALSLTAIPPFCAHAGTPGIRVGSCTLRLDQARQAGLDGVQLWAGGAAEELEIHKAETRARLKAQMRETGLPICSLMLGLLNQYPLATDPRAPAWLQQSIDAAADLGVPNILVAFFGKGDLQTGRKIKEPEFAAACRRIRDAAPRARDAGVTLSIENLLSAEQNLRMLDAIGHEAVSLYYDVYNTGKSMKYDSPAEIRFLKERITQIHFKNGPQYLDEDRPYFEAVTAAIREIRYPGWIVLETSSPSKDGVADGKRNGDFVRALFA